MPLDTLFQLDIQTESTVTLTSISKFFDAQQSIQFAGYDQYVDAEGQTEAYGLLLERTPISPYGAPDAYFVNDEDQDVAPAE